ncbi:unnamed protein product [Soboliphyme baturini]|uniref:MutL_C domain-containing protein n=1 Tax=Soboliphyme baturini TaxID=241478 RepID=A0A183IXL1_9BILA|nr:unnamed protein product [Soboliphyme baturini]
MVGMQTLPEDFQAVNDKSEETSFSLVIHFAELDLNVFAENLCRLLAGWQPVGRFLPDSDSLDFRLCFGVDFDRLFRHQTLPGRVVDCRGGDKKAKPQRVAQTEKGSPTKETSPDRSPNHCQANANAFEKRESMYSILDQDLQLSEDSESEHEEQEPTSTVVPTTDQAKDSPKLRRSELKKSRKNSTRCLNRVPFG